jgi:hypothetical protein
MEEQVEADGEYRRGFYFDCNGLLSCSVNSHLQLGLHSLVDPYTWKNLGHYKPDGIFHSLTKFR